MCYLKNLSELETRCETLRNQLHAMNSELITGSDGGRYVTIFQIKLRDGYWLGVTTLFDHDIAEIGLLKNSRPIYDDELGYPIDDIRVCSYDAPIIMAEYERLMQKLTERV